MLVESGGARLDRAKSVVPVGNQATAPQVGFVDYEIKADLSSILAAIVNQ